MSVTLRLSVFGKNNRPVYRIVACETRSKRDGKCMDNLGTYDPNTKPPTLKINNEKFQKWVKNGAIVSAGLRKITEQEKAAWKIF